MNQSPVVLYIEDDPFSRESLTLVLTRVMHIEHVYIFESGVDFIAQLKALPQKPDVILLDIQMKPYSGYDLLRLLRAEADYRTTRVVALTASVMNEQIETLRQRGFDGVIGKPISVAHFPGLMTRVLNGESVWHVIG